jgi:hypothetical protein
MRSWRVVLSLGLAVALGGALAARYAMPDVENVPIERVTANLRRMIEQAPTDVDLRVNLARVHAMAYARHADSVPVFRNGPQSGRAFLGHDPAHRQLNVSTPGNPAAAIVASGHLKAAVAAYREALALDPRHEVAGLGLGWTLIQAGETVPAKDILRRVIAAAWPVESAQESAAHGRSVVEEAAFYLLPLLDPAADAQEIAAVRQQLAGLTSEDLIDADAAVLFDADGSGIAKRWTWITPDAAWLVFDRRATGRVTSSLQLFGSVTFWLFWDNGYEALSSLDDDGDGRLRGAELEGIALWHDRSADGLSDRGEVQTLAAHGIAEISTTFERDACHPDRIAWSPRGVTFTDGSSRPTFDLILRSAGEGTVSVR